MPSLDERIGENLVRLRNDLSQRDLAAHMKRLGWKWTHVTVGSVERGERPLRLSEAADIARILAVDVRLLIEPSGNIAWNAAYLEMVSAQRDFDSAIGDYVRRALSTVSNLGDVDLTPAQEESLLDLAKVTALDLVLRRDREDATRAAELAEHPVLLDDRPFMRERMERIENRLRPIVEHWQAQAELVSGAVDGKRQEEA